VYPTSKNNTGLFGLYGNFEPTSVYEMSQAMVSSLSSLGYEVSEEDLAVAKAQVKLNVFAHSDGTTAYECENIGREMLYNGRKMHATEMLARIDAIDTNSIKNTAKRYFVDRDFALIGIGSIHELPDYQALRKLTYNHF
jgi:processing peptidase subunit beta